VNIKTRELSFSEDLTSAFIRSGIGAEAAQRAARALCRYFGGQMVFIPARKAEGAVGEKIRGVIADATDDATAQAALGKIMGLYGGSQIYVPLERCEYRKIIALEIFTRYGKDGKTMNDYAREYNISCNSAYRLWRVGQREHVKSSLPYQPYLDFYF
jgi:Mor family transcriptional regulator